MAEDTLRIAYTINSTLAHEIAQMITHEAEDWGDDWQAFGSPDTLARIAAFAGDYTGRTAFYTILASGTGDEAHAIVWIAQAFMDGVDEAAGFTTLDVSPSQAAILSQACAIATDGDGGPGWIVE